MKLLPTIADVYELLTTATTPIDTILLNGEPAYNLVLAKNYQNGLDCLYVETDDELLMFTKVFQVDEYSILLGDHEDFVQPNEDWEAFNEPVELKINTLAVKIVPLKLTELAKNV